MKIIQYKEINKHIQEICDVLEGGGLVIAPTDTVYGALVLATNKKGVEKLFALKNYSKNASVSVFVHSYKLMNQYVLYDKNKEKYLNKFLPGPYTVVMPSRHKTVTELESEKGTLGIRWIDYPIINQLVEKLNRPLTATSANQHGSQPHSSVTSFLAKLPKNKRKYIDVIIDGGKLPRRLPSTVVDLSSDVVTMLRVGDSKIQTEEKIVTTKSEQETFKLGKKIQSELNAQKLEKPIIYILRGDLGTGKTVFVKGIASVFNLQNIISPTFVVMYEYKINKSKNILAHYDLYQIAEDEEFNYLGIEPLLKKGNVLCFEWGERSGAIIGELQKKGYIVYVDMEYEGLESRKITISEHPL